MQSRSIRLNKHHRTKEKEYVILYYDEKIFMPIQLKYQVD